jgi:hypothetical protein
VKARTAGAPLCSSTSKHARGEPAKVARGLARLAKLGVRRSMQIGQEARSVEMA